MYKSETTVRVRYAETDRMGYVYYGNYSQYYEVGRVEALRSLGYPYKKLEDSGIMLPVLQFSIKYFKPAYYDDLLTVVTIINEVPSTRIHFEYEIYNQQNELLNKGDTTLVFVSIETGKPCKPPLDFLNTIENFFNQ
jgi:acyl-CoA thioester hydrolase